MVTSRQTITIRTMTKADIPFAIALKDAVGWNQTKTDWDTFLQLEPHGCLLAESSDRKIATALAIDYEQTLGWISMVIVHPSQQKKGIGKMIFQDALAYLRQKGVKSVLLDASDAGRPLYESVGFKKRYVIHRYESVANVGTHTFPELHPITSVDDIKNISLWDKKYFGASRERMLKRLIQVSKPLSFCYSNKNGLAGFIICREGVNAFHVGPWVASSPSVAESLLLHVLQQIDGQKVFVDVPELNEAAVQLLRQHAFNRRSSFVRMGLQLADVGELEDITGIYATSGPEKG